LTFYIALCRVTFMGNEIRITGPVLKVLQQFFEAPTEEIAGTDIANKTKLASGTLYPVLKRLEDTGWLESRWEEVDAREVGRPRKRLYKITGAGARAYRQTIEEMFGKKAVNAWA
jgi:PadR family transcriptional regulator PadR